MQCVEPSGDGGDEVCEFSEPSPWLIYTASVGELPEGEIYPHMNVYARPSRPPPGFEPIHVSEGMYEGDFRLPLFDSWSPDGRILIVGVLNQLEDNGLQTRLWSVEFGAGLPSAPRRLENLPEAALLIGAWDARSKAVTIENYDTGELFVVDFESGEGVAALSPGTRDVHHLCAGGGSVVHSADGDLIVETIDGQVVRVYPDYWDYSISTDGEILAVVLPDNADSERYVVSVAPCGEGSELDVLDSFGPGLVYLNRDGRFLAYESDLGVSVHSTEDGGEQALPERTSVFYGFGSRADFALFADARGTLFAYELEGGAQHELPFPEADEWSWYDDYLTRTISEEGADESRALEFYAPLTSSEPLFVVTDEIGFFEDVTPDGRSFVYEVDGEAGTRVVMRELAPAGRTAEFASEELSLSIKGFSGDSRGLVAERTAPEYEVYYLEFAAYGRPPEIELLHRSEYGGTMTAQPCPACR